jgi:hypothetical protein
VRLQGQQKGGFYPAHPDAIRAALSHVNPRPAGRGFPLLDPCCGEGLALKQLADETGGMPHGIELDEGRGAKAVELLGDKVLAPASVFGCRASGGAFSLAWVNPPYDDELGGGGREEHKFLMHVTPWIIPGGVLMFVVPEQIIRQGSPSNCYLRERFDDVRWMPFPSHVRPYKEVVVFGVRRARSNDLSYEQKWHEQIGPIRDEVYHVPAASAPRFWEKVELTPDEVGRALAASPLQKLLEPPKDVPLPRPPLPLGKGHIAMLLASGHLDGVVRPDGEEPHLVRGTAAKVQYLKEATEEERPDGSVTLKEVFAEKILLKVRAVDRTGTIKTFE